MKLLAKEIELNCLYVWNTWSVKDVHSKFLVHLQPNMKAENITSRIISLLEGRGIELSRILWIASMVVASSLNIFLSSFKTQHVRITSSMVESEKSAYPCLAILACKYFLSLCHKCIWIHVYISFYGHIVSKQQNSLKPDKGDKLVFKVKNWNCFSYSNVQ